MVHWKINMKQFLGVFWFQPHMHISDPHAHFKLFRRLPCPDWKLTGSALGKLAPVPWLCVLLVIVGEASGW